MEIILKNFRVGYINLAEYPNRNQSMVNMLESLGLKYFRVEGEKSLKYDPIAISHLKALDSGADLILEDDCLPTKNYRETFEVPDDADVLFLGLSTGTTKLRSPKYIKVSEEICRLQDMTTMHAVLYLNERGREWLEQCHDLTAEKKIGFDIATAKLMTTINAYGLNKPIWYQRDIPEQTNITLDEALLSDEYSGGGFPDYSEPISFK